ncbi:MAG: thioredoxin domain-containing protein [Candidatus Eisenbacteria bacterium]
MNKITRVGIVLAVVAALVVVVLLKERRAPAEAPVAEEVKLPRLVDLGANTCIPCKMMAPILEELKTEYRDRFEVQVIDVREQREVAQGYAIRMIPTQVFFDSGGKELFRHEGFLSKEAILEKWKELGLDMGAGG